MKKLEVDVSIKDIIKKAQFELQKGQKVALIGLNGAGKSSLLKSIMGLGQLPTKGRIGLNGQNILGQPTVDIAKQGCGIVHQHCPIIKGVSLRQLLKLINHEWSKQQIDELSKKLGINYLLERDLNEDLSGGEKRRVELAQVIVQDPDLVLIDELDSGVDIDSRQVIYQVLSEFLTNKTAIIVSHDFEIFDFIKVDKVMLIANKKLRVYSDITVLDKIRKVGFGVINE